MSAEPLRPDDELAASSGNAPPRRVGDFQILEKLGQGAMGAVYKARQRSLDRIVAVKILPGTISRDGQFIKRFQREARASAKLNHPNVVQGIDVGQDEASGLWYFAMEWVDGPSLKQVLQEQKVLPPARAIRIVADVARALECATRHGIVHRDIKPDNILLSATGEAKLADLGLAKNPAEDGGATLAGTAVGTPHYMAPEQARGETQDIDVRADIYALGATFYHLVTGRPPFTGPTSAVVMTRHITEPAPLAHKVNPQVGEACGRLIARMMAKHPSQRVQTPSELLAHLEELRERVHAPAQTKPAPRPRIPTAESRRAAPPPTARKALALLGALPLVAAAIGYYSWRHANTEISVPPGKEAARPPAVPPVPPPGPSARDMPAAPPVPAPVPPPAGAAWPSNARGLVFLLPPGGKPAGRMDAPGQRELTYSLAARGQAKIDANGALLVKNGAFIVQGMESHLLQACRSTHELTLEVIFVAENLSQAGPARIVSYSTDAHTRNFTLGQEGANLILRLRTPHTGLNGTPPQTVLCDAWNKPQHIIVSYAPGKLICYRNGEQVLSTDHVKGDFSNWTPQTLILGDELNAPRDWAGTIEAVAIYSRFLSPQEAKANAAAFQAAGRTRGGQ